MINISQTLGLPTIFIRYNPDEFKINGEEKNPFFMDRMKILSSVLKDSIELGPEKLSGFVSIRKLFFNDGLDSGYHVVLGFEK